MSKLCIGLFGTCGNSKWRDKFISEFNISHITYFNPQIDNWTPECAEVEAEHLANDDIILFPITNETYATGSLAEVGFSILNAIRLDDRRDFVVMIDKNLVEELNDPIARKESLRARALVKQHLKKLRLPNLYLVDSLDDMLYVASQLWTVALIREPLKYLNPQNIK
jgi:hypothetical protein